MVVLIIRGQAMPKVMCVECKHSKFDYKRGIIICKTVSKRCEFEQKFRVINFIGTITHWIQRVIMNSKILLIFMIIAAIGTTGCSTNKSLRKLESRLDKIEERVDINEDWLFFIENEVLTKDVENEK